MADMALWHHIPPFADGSSSSVAILVPMGLAERSPLEGGTDDYFMSAGAVDLRRRWRMGVGDSHSDGGQWRPNR